MCVFTGMVDHKCSVFPNSLHISVFYLGIHKWSFCTEMERLLGWQPWYSLETLKTSFNVSSEYQGCRSDDLSVSVWYLTWIIADCWNCARLVDVTSTHGYNRIAKVMNFRPWQTYRKVSNIRRTLVGNKIVDHSDVVGASPVGAAPTTSS